MIYRIPWQVNVTFDIEPDVAKVEDTAAARRQGIGCSRLRRTIDNKADAASSAFL
jgi:hypothetical protein